ncbi:3'(2'),5'-bisphosphate nucleotidase CysQ [Yinghuangia sp. ASG 101]|uniref:3'(2'),5'-bisphosphate nucleotidase CysQ n=1 Tax=Yinghuangia sp. ASG 101 TaxID=2896848 RepID=UPI001E2F3173|nr:3'(2'),5'-bisphosphate nucleotidase CysQ [Yinghuangia sp. ASG 101]UGQ10987.1 3'(2'),5'-bisphosphate nucleotidase CysQ [Yinghuangia sp. ASG 101]
MDDHTLAAAVAAQAGALLRKIRTPGGGKQGDQESNELLLRLLAHARPDDAILSEESADDPNRLLSDRVWIIDPLDGTREYGEPPRDDWAVHVALAVCGRPVVGAVALPAAGLVLHTGGRSARAPRLPGPLRIVASRTRAPACVDSLVTQLDAQVVHMGSAGAKAMAVVRGQADIYAHAGGQYEWDSCAPVAVAAAAGLHVSRLDGTPLRYNQPSPYLPDVLICRPSLVDSVLEALEST